MATPVQDAAREQLADLFQSLAPVIGPTDEDDTPLNAFLSGWVAITAWTDAEGHYYLTRIGASHQPLHVQTGLLHEALFGDWVQSDV